MNVHSSSTTFTPLEALNRSALAFKQLNTVQKVAIVALTVLGSFVLLIGAVFAFHYSVQWLTSKNQRNLQDPDAGNRAAELATAALSYMRKCFDQELLPQRADIYLAFQNPESTTPQERENLYNRINRINPRDCNRGSLWFLPNLEATRLPLCDAATQAYTLSFAKVINPYLRGLDLQKEQLTLPKAYKRLYKDLVVDEKAIEELAFFSLCIQAYLLKNQPKEAVGIVERLIYLNEEQYHQFITTSNKTTRQFLSTFSKGGNPVGNFTHHLTLRSTDTLFGVKLPPHVATNPIEREILFPFGARVEILGISKIECQSEQDERFRQLLYARDPGVQTLRPTLRQRALVPLYH